MNLKSILCFCLTAVTLTLGKQSQDGEQSNGDASYEFGYDIHNPVSNDIKSHHEIRDGKNVLGFYTFKEADGSIRIVKYKVGPETGFEAVVEKIKPDLISGNSIDGQEASPSTHGAPETINEPISEAGHKSRFVSGTAGLVHGIHGNTGLHNPHRDVAKSPHVPEQKHVNRNPSIHDHRQRYVNEPQQHETDGRHRDPYVIRRNPHRNIYQPPLQLPAVYGRVDKAQYTVQNNQGHSQRRAEEATYVDVPRGRQRNQYISRRQPNPRQLQIQETLRPYVNDHKSRVASRVHGQVQPYESNLAQPVIYDNSQIVYIDGVPYIDNGGTTTDSQGQNGELYNNGGQVYAPKQEQVQDPQYEVHENPEGHANEKAVTNDEIGEPIENEETEEYDDDEEDEDHSEYEEDEDRDDEDTDSTEFYEENEQLINEQQKEYDRLKKAYEEDGQESNSKKQETEQQESEPVQSQ